MGVWALLLQIWNELLHTVLVEFPDLTPFERRVPRDLDDRDHVCGAEWVGWLNIVLGNFVAEALTSNTRALGVFTASESMFSNRYTSSSSISMPGGRGSLASSRKRPHRMLLLDLLPRTRQRDPRVPHLQDPERSRRRSPARSHPRSGFCPPSRSAAPPGWASPFLQPEWWEGRRWGLGAASPAPCLLVVVRERATHVYPHIQSVPLIAC